MRYFLMLLMLSALVFGAACQNTSTTTTANKTKPVNDSIFQPAGATPKANDPAADAPRINLADAKKDFDDGAALFVDTRAAIQYNEKHIKGAINIPAEAMDVRIKEIPKDKKIIAYCS